MSLLEAWIILIGLGFSLATPLGPVNLEMMKNALNSYYTKSRIRWSLAVITGIGAMTGDFIIAFIALTIGGVVIQSFIADLWIKAFLFLINFLVLLYLGFSALKVRTIDIADDIEIKNVESTNSRELQVKLVRQYSTGFILVITSPWSFIWWASFGSVILFSNLQIIALEIPGRILLVLFFLSGIFLWIIIFTVALILLGRLPNQKLINYMIKGSALLLLGFAVLIGIDGLCTVKELLLLGPC
ncbi:MAG: LysE family transporter [Candidatus Thorarchaeota archaeon]